MGFKYSADDARSSASCGIQHVNIVNLRVHFLGLTIADLHGRGKRKGLIQGWQNVNVSLFFIYFLQLSLKCSTPRDNSN